ncbi:hypothetical protein OS493_030393 [Desmophyllum pertusum]|uniref:Uncharacterized protein n=1 Tax=Desmophyllum pertusum TaxID=174260 RepID=A0A9W9Z8L5_9CNID|nr:hypothetical protein OS493_030393 [Desmophyllum pertusum]
MNGDAFFPLKRRPGDIERIFWKEPMDDKEMFKLPNGSCSLSSGRESTAKAEKRTRQVDFMLNNVDSKRSSWFYYDIDTLCLYREEIWLLSRREVVKERTDLLRVINGDAFSHLTAGHEI